MVCFFSVLYIQDNPDYNDCNFGKAVFFLNQNEAYSISKFPQSFSMFFLSFLTSDLRLGPGADRLAERSGVDAPHARESCCAAKQVKCDGNSSDQNPQVLLVGGFSHVLFSIVYGIIYG